MRKNRRALWLLLAGVCLAGCASGVAGQAEDWGIQIPRQSTLTPFQPAAPTLTPTPQVVRLGVDGNVPAALRDAIQLGSGVEWAQDGQPAEALISVVGADESMSVWVYALVAPFPTVRDGVSLEELKGLWRGEPLDDLQGQPLYVDEATRLSLEAQWGEPASGLVETAAADALLNLAWQTKTAWAIVPFERLDPRWKVLRVDGVSPFDAGFSAQAYGLTVDYGLMPGTSVAAAAGSIQLPPTNRDAQKMTSLLMTGVTALTRATGRKMETEGMTYPAVDVIGWFEQADLVHISNEVSFTDTCPPANPGQTALQFCSRPEYLELLDYIGVDIMELSGNHLMDWGWDPFTQSMQIYQERGWKTFAAGSNLEEARQPLLLEHHGNRLAFIGCNPAGPARVWATEEFPGVATCDYDWMAAEIRRLREEGYLVIATQQFFESYGFEPGAEQIQVFNRLANAGAVIVSGSQAHHPQGMAFTGEGGFIHYGLGNLFFDQMRMPDGAAPEFFSAGLPIAGVRLEFLDRHIFYEGRYLGTELYTAVLEDYARPRPMTEEERDQFLKEAFERSDW